VRLVHWVVTAPLALVVVVFAVSNRDSILVTFWPLPMALAAPIYLVVLLALLVGFLFGELVAWLNAGRTRREMRNRGRRIEALERELAAAQTQAQLPPVVPQRPRLPP
jgi:lipopolysaccharide assembly protein A